MAQFPNLTTQKGLASLEEYLTHKSYITGYVASRDDLLVYSSLGAAPEQQKYPNLSRWFKHINALLGASFPGEGKGVKIEGQAEPVASAGPIHREVFATETPVTVVEETTIVTPAIVDDEDLGKDVMDEDDDDDLDLFGEMTEEEKQAAEDKKRIIEEKKKKAAEKNKLSKSMIIMDVKPWDDTTDLGEMEKFVRSIQHDGLLWGQAKLVPVGFGIRKLQITAVIEDVKIESMDIIIEDEIVQDGENPFIQSVDVVAFNKI